MSVLKFHRQCLDDAASLGIDSLQIVERGKHVMMTGQYRSKPVTYFLSRSPSDWRVRQKIRSDLRRRVRAIANQDAL